MTRRTLVSSLAAAPALLGQAGRKRNLVFILSDDHRHDVMSCMGHPFVKTPHLDRLANGGVLFRNSFVTTALCSPSRATVLTGQYVHAHGVLDNITPLPANLETFPQVLQKHGYRTGMIGKWHMGGDSDEPRPGYDRWVSFRGQGVYENPTINFDGERRSLKGYVSDILTEEAVRFIGENRDRPFMLHLAHKAVHADFFPAPRHRDLYSNVAIPRPKSMADTEENYRGKPEWVRRQRNSWHGVDGMYNGRVDFEQFYRDYCRTLAAMDDSVGKVIDELDRRKLLNDTLIVYMGDNGFQFGEHGLIDKRTMYEKSIRIPMIAHCPDLFQPSRQVAGLALNLDIGPTLLDAAGARPMPQAHGRSLLPLLRGGASTPADWRRDFLYEYFWERDFPQTPTVIGLRSEQYSFMQYHGVWDLDELYDVQNDPDQMKNLLAHVRVRNEAGRNFQRIQEPGLRKQVAGFQQRIAEIMRTTGGLVEPRWKG